MPDPAEIGERLRALVAELREAVVNADRITDEASVRIEGVTVRVWSEVPDEPPWELDLALGTSGTLRERYGEGRWQEVSIADPHQLPPAFAELPISALKEMSRVREASFHEVGVKTLGELAGMSDEQVLQLVRVSDSHLPLEFRTKARLLAVPPIGAPTGGAADRSLYSLFGRPSADLQELAGAELSPAASRQAVAQLTLAGTALDEETMRSLTLADLSARRSRSPRAQR